MVRRQWLAAGGVALMTGYLAFWPVPVAPVAWEAPEDKGLTGDFAPNTRLAKLTLLDLAGAVGPEDAVQAPDGHIFVSTHDGIIKLDAQGENPQRFGSTWGRPLGVAMHPDGDLIVADAYLGLMAVAPDGNHRVLTDKVDGQPIRYADAVDIAPDGRIIFTDASSKFGAQASGGTFEASKLDILEHGGHGRLLAFTPQTGVTTVLAKGLQFANGVAIDPSGQFALVCETGSYRVVRIPLDGSGRIEPILSNLPGFPDNIRRGRNGRYWVGLVSPRRGILDMLSTWPRMRAAIQRLPAFMRPDAVRYAHLLSIDATGKVLASLQHDSRYGFVTGALETTDHLFVTSLKEPVLGRIPAESGKNP
jgi:sugar lactone lactonase YvrE